MVTNDLSGADLPHWTYWLYFHSNYSTHSLYHFEKPAFVATKTFIFHFYACQTNKGDIWLQFESIEKNPPGGSVIQKNQKQILKS